jgi:hypothetical protein
MTDHERQAITAKLVELRFWGTDEPGDPVGDYHDAKTLHARVGARLAGDVFVVSTFASSHSSARRVLISHGERLNSSSGPKHSSAVGGPYYRYERRAA